MSYVVLSQVASIIMGQSPPSSTYNIDGNGLPFFQGKTDFGEVYPRPRVYCSAPNKFAEPGDILISVRAPVGPTNLNKVRSCIGRGLSAIRIGPHLDRNYLYYFLKFYEPKLVKAGTGSTFSAISRDDLENIKLPLPPLPEQQRIATILQKADRLRQLRRYARHLSDGYLQSVFQDILRATINEKTVDFSEIVKIDRRKATEIEKFTLPYIGLEDIEKERGELIRNFSFTPREMLATNYSFTSNHILYGKLRPYLNKVLIPSFDGTCSTEILPLLPDEKSILKSFLATYLMGSRFVDWASKNVEGANLPRLSPDRLAEYTILLPPIGDQKKFDNIFTNMKSTQKKNVGVGATSRESISIGVARRISSGFIVMDEIQKFISEKYIEILQLANILLPLLRRALKRIIFRIKFHGFSEEIIQIAAAINNASWSNLSITLPTIDKVGLIKRLEISQIIDIWKKADTPLLLHGEAGSGKTGIAIRLGQYIANLGIPVLFLNAKELPLTEDPVTFLEKRLSVRISLVEAFLKLSKKKTSVVIIDQIDSITGTDICKELISLLKTLIAIPNVKVLGVTRSFEYLSDPDLTSLNFTPIECGQLSQEEAQEYLFQLGINEPDSLLIELAKNLLNLSLIGEIINSTPDSVRFLTNEISLWRQFLISIEKREGKEVAAYAHQIAREVTKSGETSFISETIRNRLFRKLVSRSIISSLPGRRYAFRHEQMQYFLCAYDLMPERPDIEDLLSEFSGKALISVISWLHRLYHSESAKLEAKFVDDVLSAEKVLPFYSRIAVLDNLREQTHPFDELAVVLIKHGENIAYQQYFFKELENPAWILPLFKFSLFHKYPEPINVEGKGYLIPDWPAGEYLAKNAKSYEDIVLDITLKANTENWRVQEILIDALLKINPEKAAQSVHMIDAWLDTRFSDMLPVKLLPLTNHFLDKGCIQETIRIFQNVISPKKQINSDRYSSSISPFRFRSDPYWVNDYYQKVFPKLIEKYSFELVSVFQTELEKIIDQVSQITLVDPETQVGYYWRLDIPFRFSSRADGDVIDLLVDGLRDCLVTLCNQSIEVGRDKLVAYLDGKHLILQRIAVYVLRKCGNNYPDLVERELAKFNNLEDRIFDEDYRGLLRDQFGTISQKLRNEIIGFILSGPSYIEEKAKSWASVENREPTAEDALLIIDRWRFQLLPLIKGYLSPEEIAILDAIIKKYGQEPDIREHPSIEIGPVKTASSPIPTDQLIEMDLSKLKELFISYDPKDDFLINRDSLGREFQTIVSNNSEKYLEFAPHLMDERVRFVYTLYFLRGITEGIKKGEINITSDILQLCQFILGYKDESIKLPREPYEPGLDKAKREVANLLDEVVQKDDYSIKREQLDSIREMLILLAHHADPTEEKEKESSMDPFTYSLNCIRGKAMHGIFDYSLFIVRQKAKQEEKERIPGFIEDPIIDLLNEKLTLDFEKSPAVRSVFGAYLNQLYYLSKEWVEAHLDQLFVSEPELEAYWKAAWDGYIFGSNVNNDVFKLLIPQYQRGLMLLSQAEGVKEYFGGSPNERLAQHIMVVYLRGLTDFGHENQILELFFENAPDQIRSQAIFWLSKVLENEKPKGTSDLWQRCWKLWQTRLEKAEKEDPEKNGQEISDYMRWLVSTPMSLDQLFATLQKSIKYFQDSYDVMQLSEYVERYSDKYPLEAITLLYKSVTTAKEPWWRASDDKEENILRNAMTSKNQKARDIAIDLINFHGEQGDYRWKDLLDL